MRDRRDLARGNAPHRMSDPPGPSARHARRPRPRPRDRGGVRLSGRALQGGRPPCHLDRPADRRPGARPEPRLRSAGGGSRAAARWRSSSPSRGRSAWALDRRSPAWRAPSPPCSCSACSARACRRSAACTSTSPPWRPACATGGLAAGRRAVSMIVGRDPDSLDGPAVCRAAIESLAENFSDGIVAPAFWIGVPGPARRRALQGDQHRRQHDRPPQPALRGLRLGGGPARRPA